MKNKYILIANFFVAFCLLLTVSRASLFCTITQGDCIGSNDFPGTLVLRISDLTNAHAELPTENNYPYRVCCNASYDTIRVKINEVCNEKEGRFISLSSSKNAHVEIYDYTNYLNDICLNSSIARIECGVKYSCGADEVCMLSVSDSFISGGEILFTNSHVGSCDAYPTKICCKYTAVVRKCSDETPQVSVISPKIIAPGSEITLNITFRCLEWVKGKDLNITLYLNDQIWRQELCSINMKKLREDLGWTGSPTSDWICEPSKCKHTTYPIEIEADFNKRQSTVILKCKLPYNLKPGTHKIKAVLTVYSEPKNLTPGVTSFYILPTEISAIFEFFSKIWNFLKNPFSFL